MTKLRGCGVLAVAHGVHHDVQQQAVPHTSSEAPHYKDLGALIEVLALALGRLRQGLVNGLESASQDRQGLARSTKKRSFTCLLVVGEGPVNEASRRVMGLPQQAFSLLYEWVSGLHHRNNEVAKGVHICEVQGNGPGPELHQRSQSWVLRPSTVHLMAHIALRI